MGLSRDQVIWVYRIFLKREPESEDHLAQIMESYDSRFDLILSVMDSEEFKAIEDGATGVAIHEDAVSKA